MALLCEYYLVTMDEQQPTDEAVVVAALADKEQFGVLMDRYEAKLRRYIARLGIRNPDDQLDVLQDIFIKVYRNLNGFDQKLKFSSWIYRIAHNEAISAYRKKNVRPEGHLIADSEELLSFAAGNLDSAELQFDHTINAEVLQQALLKLDKKYEAVLILRFFEHKDYDEISDILQIPIGSVGTLIHRGKKQLATVINNEQIRI